jgi:hypothetical protein
VVIDHGVDVVVTKLALGPTARLPAVDAMATPWRNPSQLLDVDVNQLSGPLSFVAADEATGGAIEPVEAVQVVADQDLVAGGAWPPGERGEAVRAQLPLLAELQDGSLLLSGQASRSAVRMRRPVFEPSLPLLAVSTDPFVAGGPGDPSGFGCSGDRPAGPDAIDQQLPTVQVETRATMHARALLRSGLMSPRPSLEGSLRVNKVRGSYT